MRPSKDRVGMWQASVYYTGTKKIPSIIYLNNVCTIFVMKRPWGRICSITNFSQICPAIMEMFAFKVSIMFFAFFLIYFFSHTLEKLQ